MSITEITRVIAFDPGATTGWAKGLIKDGRMWVISGQAKWDHLAFYEEMTLFKPDELIYERFDYRKMSPKGKAGVELISREYIGVINLYLAQRNKKYISVHAYPQFPAEALGGYWQSDAKLKAEHVYMVGKPHANDAMRHLLHWFVFKEGFKYNKEGFMRLDASESMTRNLVEMRPWL